MAEWIVGPPLHTHECVVGAPATHSLSGLLDRHYTLADWIVGPQLHTRAKIAYQWIVGPQLHTRDCVVGPPATHSRAKSHRSVGWRSLTRSARVLRSKAVEWIVGPATKNRIHSNGCWCASYTLTRKIALGITITTTRQLSAARFEIAVELIVGIVTAEKSK